MNILLIDGRDEVRGCLSAHLRRAGHQVEALSEPEPALAWLEGHRPDVVMVERGVLLRQGEPLLSAVSRHGTPPGILLPPQPLGESELGEVIARVERVEEVRRQVEEAARDLAIRLRVGDLIVDQAKRRVIFQGRIIRLTPTQYRLLHCLACHAGRVVGYRELLRQVWGFDTDEVEARDLLKVHIRQIRRKMGLSARQAEYLQSVRGFGYMLVDPHEDELLRSSPK